MLALAATEVGRLISNRWGGEVGLLALAATKVGRLISNRWGGESGQFTEAFMEGGVGTFAQEWRDLRVR